MNPAPATIFVAFDGQRFFEEKDCAAYEAAHWHRLIEGMTAEQIQQSLDRTDVERADAIERAARIIAKKRIESGVRLRNPKTTALGQRLIKAVDEAIDIAKGNGSETERQWAGEETTE